VVNQLAHGTSSWTWQWTELKNTKVNLNGQTTSPPHGRCTKYTTAGNITLSCSDNPKMSEKENENGRKCNRLNKNHAKLYIIYRNQAQPLPPPPLLPPESTFKACLAYGSYKTVASFTTCNALNMQVYCATSTLLGEK